MELSSSFANRVAARGKVVAVTAELEARLSRLVDEGRAAWPGLAVAPRAFVAHVAERLPEDCDAVAALDGLHANDLYLAYGCLQGDPAALAAFEEHFVSRMARFLARFDYDTVEVDEIKQTLRARLLVAEQDQPARIGEYAGRGPLVSWLRRAAVRTLLYRRRAKSAEGPLVPEAASLPATGPDPELLYLKVRYGGDLDAAFREALGSLSERDRTLLSLYFVNGLTADTLASMYRVAESTVRRWLADSRKSIVDETRRRLAERLDISATECRSLVVLLKSQLDLSVVRMLKDDGKD